MTDFEEGDLVQVRNLPNAPPMSVQAVADNGKLVTCMWFDVNGALQEKVFLSRTLQKYTQNDGVSGS